MVLFLQKEHSMPMLLMICHNFHIRWRVLVVVLTISFDHIIDIFVSVCMHNAIWVNSSIHQYWKFFHQRSILLMPFVGINLLWYVLNVWLWVVVTKMYAYQSQTDASATMDPGSYFSPYYGNGRSVSFSHHLWCIGMLSKYASSIVSSTMLVRHQLR